MLKTKYALSAFCMLVAMTMATSAFAQGIFTVSSSIEPRARLNGQTEEAGGITLSLTSGSIDAGESGEVTIDYGTTITNSLTTAGNAIVVDICGATGSDANTTISGNGIVLTVDGDTDTCVAGESIDVSGVLLAIAGQGLSDVSANILSSGNVRLGAGANEVTVINSVVDELTDNGVTSDALTVIRHTGDSEGDVEHFSLLIEENAVDSFDGAVLGLDFSGIGLGMSVTLDAWATTKEDLDDFEATEFVLDDGPDDDIITVAANQQLAFDGGADAGDTLTATVTAQDSEARVLMNLGDVFDADDAITSVDETSVTGGSLSANDVDVVVIRGTIAFTTGGPTAVSFPLGDLDIAASVTVGPVGAAVPPRFGAAERGIPRFASDASHSVTVINATSDQTSLTLPYALSNGVFDTGIAIANMNTADDQSGAITFALYQTGEDMVEYTTLDELAAGGTMAVLLSDILNEVGVETFQGYIMITTDFTGADGLAYISDWAAFSATATLDVVE